MKIHLPTTTKPQSTSHQTHTTKHHKCTLTLNPPPLQNKTTDAVIQQHSRKLLMMDILMSEKCWAHKKWNKIASDIKLVFYSSAIRGLYSDSSHPFWTVFNACNHINWHSLFKQTNQYYNNRDKVIRLITVIKKYESWRQKFKENRILTVSDLTVCSRSFVLRKEVQGKF